MKTTHAGLGITQANWDKSVQLLVATLNQFNVPQKEQQEVLAAVSTLTGDIVEQP
jgi:hemoglobin